MKKVLFWILLPLSLAVAQRSVERVQEVFNAKSGETLEVFLVVDAAEVYVTRSGDPLQGRIDMKFSRDEFSDRIVFNQERNRLRVELEKRSWTRFRDRDGDDLEAVLTLELPDGVEILFDSKVKAGEVEMELGGLRLREFCFNNWAGEVEVRFDSPNPVKMDFLEINARVGECRFLELGNARFEKADINGGIGELRVDFTGELLNESMAKVDLDIGEVTVILPAEVGIQMEIGSWGFLSDKTIDRDLYKRGGFYYNDDYQSKSTQFYLRITPGLGALSVELY